MIDIYTFVTDCRDAVRHGQDAAHDVVRTALVDPERFGAALLQRPKPWFFTADDDLTVFCTSGAPGSASAPHDHATWSVLGCFAGAEESWWHEPTDEGLTTTGHGVLRAGESHALPADAVHSVMNRWDTSNGVVHVYAGNFLALERTLWDPVTAQRTPAGLKEMTAPLGTTTAFDDQRTDTGSGLGGTMFATISTGAVDETVGWLRDTFGFEALTDDTETCSVDERFMYLIEPTSLTIIGVHHNPQATVGLDHLAIRVTGTDALATWHERLGATGASPSPITAWNFGTFTEITGPGGVRIRLIAPRLP